MNHKPFIVAICGIIAVAIVLLMALGPDERVSPTPGSLWTLTYSIPASNSTVILASGSGVRIAPTSGDLWTLTSSITVSNRPAAFQTNTAPQPSR
jgi:hypothetical protein